MDQIIGKFLFGLFFMLYWLFYVSCFFLSFSINASTQATSMKLQGRIVASMSHVWLFILIKNLTRHPPKICTTFSRVCSIIFICRQLCCDIPEYVWLLCLSSSNATKHNFMLLLFHMNITTSYYHERFSSFLIISVLFLSFSLFATGHDWLWS